MISNIKIINSGMGNGESNLRGLYKRRCIPEIDFKLTSKEPPYLINISRKVRPGANL